jgi:hypothetical protein
MNLTCAGKPEKVRTASCLVAPLWPRVAGVQTASGCLFRTLFLWLLSFGDAKESNSITLLGIEDFIKAIGCTFKVLSFYSRILNADKLYESNPGGRTGKGANRALFGGAFMASCSGRTNSERLSFPDTFSLVTFFWRRKRKQQ